MCIRICFSRRSSLRGQIRERLPTFPLSYTSHLPTPASLVAPSESRVVRKPHDGYYGFKHWNALLGFEVLNRAESFLKLALQQNLWVNFGSGKSPS